MQPAAASVQWPPSQATPALPRPILIIIRIWLAGGSKVAGTACHCLADPRSLPIPVSRADHKGLSIFLESGEKLVDMDSDASHLETRIDLVMQQALRNQPLQLALWNKLWPVAYIQLLFNISPTLLMSHDCWQNAVMIFASLNSRIFASSRCSNNGSEFFLWLVSWVRSAFLESPFTDRTTQYSSWFTH